MSGYRRSLLTLAAALVAVVTALGLTPPAGGIVGGALDGDRHPNVGVMVAIDVRPRGHIAIYTCSGTLVAPAVYLTASHCLPERLSFAQELVEEGLEIDELRVSFASEHAMGEDLLGPFPEFAPYVEVDSWAINPDYPVKTDRGATAESIANDYALVYLDRSAASVFPGVTPAALPPAGYLDRVAKRDYVLVGYGTYKVVPPVTDELLFDGSRRWAAARQSKLTSTYMELRGSPLSNSSEESGVSCPGDSGGAIFHGSYLVGVISAGDFLCQKYSLGPRLDGAQFRGFLADQGFPLP
jgi:hypothetical protein